MSLFRRRLGRDKKKKNKKKPAKQTERKAPTLGAMAGETQWGEIKAKVQGEVCAVMARTILELIQSSQARTPAVDELIQRQTINRLYADVLYEFLSRGAPPSVDPADQVIGWAREAMENWGKDKRYVNEDMARETAALADSILAVLESASRDETLRKAAEQRFKGTGKLTAED